jgi:hypothetical protein
MTTTQSPVVSQLLGGSNLGRSKSVVNIRHRQYLTCPITYLYNVLRNMLLEELKDLSL